jgi:hypothetical protein
MPPVLILSNILVETVCRLLVILIAVLMSTLPLIAVLFVQDIRYQFLVMILADVAFVFVLSFLGKAKTSKLLAASVWYVVTSAPKQWQAC